MKTTIRILGTLLTLLTCVTAPAQSVPQLINYQGRLLDANGVALPTGDYEVEINLYPVEAAGAPIWGPQKFNGLSGPGLGAKVPVVDGHFNLILGPSDTGNRELAGVFAAGASVFIELKVGSSSPIAPRQQMLTAPYALRALTAAGLKGTDILADGYLGVGTRATNSYPLEILGGALFRTGGSGGSIAFATPSAETGFTMGIVNRADIRFDDSTLKLLSGAGRSPRGVEQGIAIATSGNVGIGVLAPSQKLHVNGNILATGAIIPNSDVNAKADFAPVDTAAILKRVVEMPIQQWRFKTEDAGVKHLGPMAQDFRAAFGLGEVPTAIATVDADGVALAAIQGLHGIVREKEAEIEQLKRSLLELQAQVNRLMLQRAQER